jgi:hypothetical protein
MNTLQNDGYVIAKIDFYNDWIEELRQRLIQAGYQPTQSVKGLDVCKQYFGLLQRMVAPQPRKVVISKELVCPPEVKLGFEIFKKKVEQGDDLIPHLSRGLKNPDNNDMMLNDWGIHHFHLGTKLEIDGFIERTKPVLFARVTSDTIYFIIIKEHGAQYPEVWVEQEIIQIVHDNWPNLIKQYKTDFLSFDKISQSTRREFRKMGVMTMTEVSDGTIYLPFGGGYASDGTSMNLVMTHDENARFLRGHQEKIREKIDVIATQIYKFKGYEGKNFSFQLILLNDQFFVHELNSGAKTYLAPMVFVSL